MKKTITLLCSIVLFCTAQLAHADFKVQNGSVHPIKVQHRGKYTTIRNRETAIFVTSGVDDIRVTGTAGLSIKTTVPRDKTMLVEYKSGKWSFTFKR